MFVEELETFVRVVESGSFAKAAEPLYVTPAAVMKQMNALEREVGVALLERSSRGVRPTDAGRSLYRDALPFLRERRAMVERARLAAPGKSVTVRVGTSAMTNPSDVLGPLRPALARSHPELRIELVPFDEASGGFSRALSTMGPGGPFDCLVGVCASSSRMRNFAFAQMGSYAVECAVPFGHRLADREAVDPAELRGERVMLVRAGDSPYMDAVRDFLAREVPGAELVDTGTFYDVGVFNAAERQGAVLLTTRAWRSVHPNLVTVPVRWDFTVPYGILYPRDGCGGAARFAEAVGELLAAGPDGDAAP